jgi:capsular exopolysaccharide synthesis family protein
MNDLTFNRVADVNSRPADMATPVRKEEAAIVRYLGILKRRKWLLIAAIAVSMIVGLFVTLLMTSMYSAATTIEIKREDYQIVNVRGVESENSPTDLEFYETQWGLLRAESLAERVVTQLRLQDDPSFFEMFGKDKIASALRDGNRNGTSAEQQKRLRDAADILLGHVSIAPTRGSRLAEIRATTPDPRLSEKIANAWSQAFIETSLERRFDATSYARTFLEQRLQQLKQRLQDSERSLVRYAANERIINIPVSNSAGQEGSTERPLVAEDLSASNRELNDATAARIAAQSRLRGSGGTTTEALNNQAISSLRTKRAELASDYALMTAKFDPGYPPARALADQIGALDRSIATEENRVRSTLQAAYNAASAREAGLRQRVNGLESDLVDLRGRTIQYNIFQREVDTNRQLYDALLQRYKEIGIAGGVGVNNISVVDRAKVPERPSSPRLLVNLLVSILIGGLAGAGLAVVLEQLDQTVSDPRELEAALGLPLLGVIPRSDEGEPLDTLEDPKTPLVEAYLSTQTRLAFTTDHGIPRTLAITSTRPAEGKTTTAYAMARQLARASNRVLLIDSDMRSPSLHGMLGASGERGLSNYLAGDDDWHTMVHKYVTNLSLLPAGPLPPNAAELLTGARMSKLLSEVLKDFDHVVIDAPPVMGLADTPLIGSVVEGVLFVTESHSTPITMARIAISRLRESKSRVLGVLMTKFAAEKAQYGYGYDYGYGYGRSVEETAAGDAAKT